MTEAGIDKPPPQQFSYRIELLNGRGYDVSSPYNLDLFILLVKVHGVLTEDGYAPHHAVAAISRIKGMPAAAMATFPTGAGGGLPN